MTHEYRKLVLYQRNEIERLQAQLKQSRSKELHALLSGIPIGLLIFALMKLAHDYFQTR